MCACLVEFVAMAKSELGHNTVLQRFLTPPSLRSIASYPILPASGLSMFLHPYITPERRCQMLVRRLAGLTVAAGAVALPNAASRALDFRERVYVYCMCRPLAGRMGGNRVVVMVGRSPGRHACHVHICFSCLWF